MALGYGSSPKFRVPFNISAAIKGNDFKIGRQVGFAKAHHKIRPRRKRVRGPGLGELPNIWGFSLKYLCNG